MTFYYLGKFHDQTINLSVDISKRIILKKCDIARSMICQYFPTNTVVDKQRIESLWNEKCLQTEIKTSFFVVFNGFNLSNSKQYRKDCQRFPFKRKI